MTHQSYTYKRARIAIIMRLTKVQTSIPVLFAYPSMFSNCSKFRVSINPTSIPGNNTQTHNIYSIFTRVVYMCNVNYLLTIRPVTKKNAKTASEPFYLSRPK